MFSHSMSRTLYSSTSQATRFMHLATFEHHGHAHAGVVVNDSVISLKSAGYSDLLSAIEGGSEAFRKIESFVAHAPASATFALSSVRLRAPISKPPKIL